MGAEAHKEGHEQPWSSEHPRLPSWCSAAETQSPLWVHAGLGGGWVSGALGSPGSLFDLKCTAMKPRPEQRWLGPLSAHLHLSLSRSLSA